MKTMIFCVRDREAGNVIERFESYEEAIQALRQYEESDKKEGIYTPDFYEVADLRTYDIVFNDNNDSNNVGGEYSLEEAKDYIKSNNGTDWGYFADYKGGTVSIVCKETGEEVYQEIVR